MILLVLALSSAECADCHPRQAEAYAASRHVVANTLPVYTAPARHANTRWCASCHQPEGAKTKGLECLTCHRVAGDANAVRTSRLDRSREKRPHRAVVDKGFSVAACARCHEFKTPLPDHFDPVVYSTQPLQSTVTELAAFDPKAQCSDCHDVHRNDGGHDPALVRSAASFTARVAGEGVEVIVRAKGTGHRFPTGDPFRRVVVSVCDDPACEHPVGSHTIARRFAMVSGVWAPVIDRSLRPGEARTLTLPRGRYWRARLYYGDPRFEAGLPANEVAIDLAAGELP